MLSPYAIYQQRRFVVENSRYGTTPFVFTATPKDYYRIFFGALPALLLGLALVVAAGFLFPPAAIAVVAVFYLYLFAYFSVRMTNVLFEASRLGPHRLTADLDIKPYAGIVLVNSLATALTLGLYHPWAKVRIMRYKLEHLGLKPGGDLNAFVAAES